MPQYNIDDPAKQEEIRRGSHEYVPTEGKHGMYRPKPYKHQEYPKMLGKLPQPVYAQFRTQNGVTIPADVASANFQEAMKNWDAAMSASVVHSKAEEMQWLKENG